MIKRQSILANTHSSGIMSVLLGVMLIGSIASLALPPVSSAFSQTVSTSNSGDNETLELAIIPDQYIVSFKDPVELEQAGVAVASDPVSGLIEDLQTQGVDANINRSLSALNTAVITLSPSAASEFAGAGTEEPTPDEVVQQLEQNPLVEAAQPDMKMTGIKPILNPNATSSTFQTLPTGIDRIDAENMSLDTTNADIGILDTGVQPDHEDLNLFRAVSFTGSSTDDLCGHGTHVAGSAAGKNNSEGVVGAAPGARIWSIKVLESEDPSDPEANCSGTLAGILNGLNYVVENSDSIDVINLSLGGYCPLSIPACAATPYEDAINAVIDSGVVVVVAAGNSANPAEWYLPARFPNVVTVSAISDSDGKCGEAGPPIFFGDRDDTFASYSNYGPLVDVAAPGSDILSTWNNGGYEKITGTSMASPHVAGQAALYKSLHPDASPSEVYSSILTSATTAEDQCDGNGHGYFSGDADGISEPLVYGGNSSATNSSATNSSATNSSGTGST